MQWLVEEALMARLELEDRKAELAAENARRVAEAESQVAAEMAARAAA